ncbi:hypothetical protein C2845_PM05G20220 [Panicum miliaceum]|uniref:KANL2-like probable zinc-finger domain-containing protein n=1 Tax=Panicum miliaceum TaxID=4540 RepID=A0A3L6T1S2_PANMI|nr:hypothetical protein C2845_PM05G20220 [Panicum miliaceum]
MASSRNPDAPAAPAPPRAPAAPLLEAQTPNPSIVPGDPSSPDMEATAEALTREEVLRRRRRRAARLAGVYRRLYWAMAEEVRARHRQYVWDLARSPLEAEQPPPPPGAPIPAVGEPPRPAPVPRRKKCGFTGCKVRAMATARFCHSHILSDPKQVLYKPCAYITKSGVQGGLVTCGRPIIKSAAPSFCNIHLQRSQKSIAQAYRKVGFNPPLTGKVTPKFSVVVAECVRQIQDKRRQSLKAAARQKCTRDGKVD